MRFKYRSHSQNIYDSETGMIYSGGNSLCDLLNSLNDENEQLKKRNIELELLNDGLNYALQNIRKIDVEIDVGGDFE